MALTKATNRMITGAPNNILDWIPANLHADIADFTSTTAVHSYIQQAMDSGAGSIYFPMGKYVILAPIYFTAGVVGSLQANNLTLVGENRTSTYLWVDGTFIPSTDIDPLTGAGIISMFINKSNNGKLSFRNLRWQGNIPGGHGIYAYESAVAQASFSGDISDCWISLSSPNAGFFIGAMSNYVVQNCTFESAKTCFILMGAGLGDIQFINNAMFINFDSFIDASRDVAYKNQITVSGLNCYSHYRGTLIKGRNCHNFQLSDISFQGDPDDTYSATELGMIDFFDSDNININNFSCSGTLIDVIKFNGAKMKINNGAIDACVSAFKPYGTYSSTDVFIQNVNNTGATTASFWDQSSTQGGAINIDNCTFSNSAGYHWSTQGSPSYDVTLNNSRFINAGYPNTSADTRNLQFNTSGNVVIQNCEIGRTTTDAIANYYALQNGSGDLYVINTRLTDIAAPGSPEITTTAGPIKIIGNLINRYSTYLGSASPVSGTWRVGDYVKNINPVVGTPKGWLCTVAGTSGTWVSEGNL
tara:strand:+ start:31 stop:1620 length:1590 start_codon:yes stop_codon:yes gene_type:complete